MEEFLMRHLSKKTLLRFVKHNVMTMDSMAPKKLFAGSENDESHDNSTHVGATKVNDN